MNTIVVVILTIFTILSILFQFKGVLKNNLEKIDRFGFLPNWSFFAPIPGTFDYRILYRDTFANNIGEWQEVDLLFKSKRKVDFIWNPSKYYQKCIFDSIQGLLLESNKTDIRLIQVNWYYLLILQIVMKEPIEKEIISRQFLISKTSGFDDNKKVKPLFISNNHSIK